MPNPQAHNLKNDKAQNEAEARKKIQMMSNRLDSGDDFATLAMNYSEDTGNLRQWRRLGLRSGIVLTTHRSRNSRNGHEAQARPVQPGHSRCQDP